MILSWQDLQHPCVALGSSDPIIFDTPPFFCNNPVHHAHCDTSVLECFCNSEFSPVETM